MKQNFSVKLSLLKAALLCSVATTSVHAADVTTWGGLATTEDINIKEDIEATGTPKVISLTASTDQTIDGEGHSIIGASGYSFSINNTATITFKNLGTYSTGTSSDSTFSYKDLSNTVQYVKINASVNAFPKYVITRYKDNVALNIENSVFTNNSSRIIGLSGSTETLNIKNSVFYGNSSTVNGSMIDGNGTINIENSIFQDNHNLNDDGGIYDGNAMVNIKNSYFFNNSSVTHGGVINQYAKTLTVENSRFEGNYSAKEGGAICLDGNIDSASIKDSQFINNHNGGAYYDGGAISSAGGYIGIVDNVLFEGNNAISKGGGLYGGMTKKQKAKPAILMKSAIFRNNEASTGGGYYTDGSSSGPRQNYTYITDSEFTNNLATATGHYMEWDIPIGGGMTSATGVPMVINNTVFSGNIADPTGPDYSAGGGVYFAGGSASFPLKTVDTTFTNNSALEGGALFVDNADAAIIADTKDVVFSGNKASANTDTYNAGDDIYFQANNYGALSLNADENRKLVFNGSVASYTGSDAAVEMNINNSGITYNTYDGTTETEVTAGTAGEIQFNNKVGDEEGNIFDINLYGGTLSIGQNSTVNSGVTNPDGFINNNNFYVKGASTLNTANGIIGEFAPVTFNINAALQYELDIDLANTASDKLGAVTDMSDGSLSLSKLNVISDTDGANVKVTYSDANIGGALKDGYTITTSTATYDVTAGNDDTGSYLLFTRGEDVGGLPAAIKNGADTYSITNDQDEVVMAWTTNDLSADLTINANKHAIKTESGLDGINVGSDYTLTVNNLSDMNGFNYAVSNEGTVVLANSTISDKIINDGTLNVNESVSLGMVSGSGVMNINADHNLTTAVSGNTVNVNSGTLSGTNYLASDTNLNVLNGTVNIDNSATTVKTATFGANSTLALTVNSLSDHGSLTAETITVAEGAKLKATLAQGIVKNGETATLQLLSANNTDFNNFADSFDNNMYHFEKADKNGKYIVTSTGSAEDIVIENGGQQWVADAAKAYVDSNSFPAETIGADIANKLAALAQNDAVNLISEIKALAPTEMPVIHDHVINDSTRLFRAVDSYLRGYRDPMGVSAGDTFSDASIWAKPYYGKSKVSSNNAFEKQKSYNKGIIAGIEGKLNPDLKLGFGLHYDETKIDMLRRDLDVDTVVGFMYGEYQMSDWFINGLASYGVSDYDEEKLALGSRYTGSYDVYTTSLATTVGYQFKYFIPEVGVRYYHIKRDDYTDTAGQDVHTSNANYMRSVAGVRYVQNYGMFSPDIYLGMSYDLKSLKDNTFVALSNGSSYIVEGEKLPRLGYEFNLGLNTFLNDNIVLGASLMGLYRKDYREYTGVLRLKYDF